MHQSYRALVIVLVSFAGWSCSPRAQDLYQIELKRQCVECDLREINLAGENLSGRYKVSVRTPPLSTTPDGLDLADPVDLTRANLEAANLRRSILQGVILTDSNLSQADLSRADLRESQLSGANLRESSLERANLQGANLQGADLENANLQRADLRGADLRHANLSGTNLTDVRTDEETLPATAFPSARN